MTVPTVFVNVFDLIWDDIDISVNDPHPFFFKEDPIIYLQQLKDQGWVIYPYFHNIIAEQDRLMFNRNITSYFEATDVLEFKYKMMENLLGPIINDDLLEEFIPRADSSSFIIANNDIEKKYNITRYTPFEIFGKVDPPNISPNTMAGIVIGSYNRTPIVNTRLGTILSSERNTRRLEVFNLMAHNYNIIMVWSPVYRYQHDDNMIPIYLAEFDRPDQDNIPNVSCYVWGY